MDTYYLYHICEEKDKHDYTKGYIGITFRKPEIRWAEHKRTKDWWEKYENVIAYVVDQGDDKYIKGLEQKYREKQSSENWNKRCGNVELPFNHPAAKFARYNKKSKK